MELFDELGTAWYYWWSKRLAEDYLLWGNPIRWWARASIYTQFISVFAIIVQIIGPERIRNYGNSLKERHQNVKILEHIKWILNWPIEFYHKLKTKKENPSLSIEQNKYTAFSLRVYAILITFTAMIAVIPDPSDVVMYPIILLILAFSAILLLLTIIVTGLRYSIYLIFLAPFASILEGKKLSKLIRILTLLALLFSMHFSLLSN